MVTVGPFPSQLLWNVDNAQPSVLACQHLTNLLRLGLRRTGPKYELNLMRYLLSRLPRIVDEEMRSSKDNTNKTDAMKIMYITKKSRSALSILTKNCLFLRFQNFTLDLFHQFLIVFQKKKKNSPNTKSSWNKAKVLSVSSPNLTLFPAWCWSILSKKKAQHEFYKLLLILSYSDAVGKLTWEDAEGFYWK